MRTRKEESNLTVRKLVSRMRRQKPQNIDQVLTTTGATVQYLNGGAFRNVFAVHGLPVVIKVPLDMEDEDSGAGMSCMDHARAEWDHYWSIKTDKDYKMLREYLPEFHYFDYQTGLAVMQRYKPLQRYKGSDKDIRKLDDAIRCAFGSTDPDVYRCNLGQDEHGAIKFIDLGMFAE